MIESDPYKGLLFEVKENVSYAFLLPIPQVREIEIQSIKDFSTKKPSVMNLEFL
jgi:hypothetical protein